MTRVVDAYVLCGEDRNGWRQDVATIVATGERAGIDHHVLVAAPSRERDVVAGNDRIAALVARDPDRFDGWGRIDVLATNASSEARRCLRELGLAGLFLDPAADGYRADDPRVDAVLGSTGSLRAPVLVATGAPWWSEALQVAALATRHPGVRFLLSNGGQVNISGLGMQDAWAALESSPNLAVLTNGEYRQDFIEDVATRLGPDRILFGSGSPAFEPPFEILRVRWADLPEPVIEAMLGGTWQAIRAARTV